MFRAEDDKDHDGLLSLTLHCISFCGFFSMWLVNMGPDGPRQPLSHVNTVILTAVT